MTRKEWLYSKGLIKSKGRGRISADNKNECEKAYANGVRFDDWSPENAPAKPSSGAGGKPTEKPKPKSKEENYEYQGRFPEGQFVAYEIERKNGKRVKRSMREACCNCRVSLVGCMCDTVGRKPTIVSTNSRGLVNVIIERA